MSKRKILIGVFGVLFLFVSTSLIVFQRNYVVPILMYHSVNPDARKENRIAVSVDAFERQMRFLKERRYQVLPLESLAALIKEKRRIPRRAVAITFDDGYKDNYTYAFGILKKYSLPAAIFVIIDEIGRPDRLSWEDIREMQASGIITFGSHTLGPQPLINFVSEKEMRKQIFDSKAILEKRLKQMVGAFSYPEGRFTPRIKQLVIAAGYKLAVATNPGKRFSSSDIFALKRLRISASSDNLFVFWIEASGYYNFIREHRHK